MPFTYEAVDNAGKELSAVIDADTADDAMAMLHAQGLFVTRVTEVADEASARTGSRAGSLLAGKAGNARDRMLLTQQMSMMLHAGSQVVPALTAIQQQIEKPKWRQIIQNVCRRVEDGASLSDAMSDYPEAFDQTFRAIISAGESSGSTAEAFDRLSAMTKTQQEIKVRIIGALVYPALLTLMSVGVVGVLMFYVLPKFDELYSTLGTELPLITVVMISMSRWITDHSLAVGVLLAGLVILPILGFRLPAVKRFQDTLVTNLPLISKVVQRVILARIFRVWGTLIRSNVPLLEGLQLCRSSTNNCQFIEMIDGVVDAIEDGDSVGDALAQSKLVPPTMVSAIATGEQSGQLGKSLIFLADYLDEENTEAIGTLTRLAEPLILILMGAVVGAIAIALFLPLFDLTAAARG